MINDKVKNKQKLSKEEKLVDKKLKLSKRAIELDILRGVSILLMIIDHFFNDAYDLMPYLFYDFPRPNTFFYGLAKFSSEYWVSSPRLIAHAIVCFGFLALTGICVSFSKSNIKRGLKLAVVAELLTVATYFVGIFADMPDLMITFGILHCIALSLLVIGIIDKFFKNKWLYLVLGVIMLSVGIYIDISIAESVAYQNNNVFLLILGQIVGIKKCGSDCFPFLLNGGQIFIGVFLGKLLYPQKKSLFKGSYNNNFITFVGRNSLWVYLIHQIIIPVLFGLVLLCCGYHFIYF